MAQTETLETDYLVIGSGAAGLAFTDTLIDECDAQVLIVDRHAKPGGHWNDAYPFVTLHQPSAFYGVNSMPLGSGRKDEAGLNRGLYELATGAEICSYYERVMSQRLLPSGRVTYRPMCHVLGRPAEQAAGEAEFESLLSGARTRVKVRRKVVDATYFSPVVPSTHRPRFSVGEGVRLVPPNALPQLLQGRPDEPPPGRFVVLGAGKTAMDVVIWLLGAGADPDRVQWVVPRDSWLVNRVTTQPAPEFFNESIGTMAAQMEAMAQASSTEDLFLRMEGCGAMLRIHPDRWPTMFHFATVAPGEVEVLRRVGDVVRLGRVLALAPDHMQLQQGRVPVAPGSVFIDCTASAVEARPTQPVFQPGRIVPQVVRLPQPTFSAALTAYVEVHYEGDKEKNRLCGSVPFPHTLAEYAPAMLVHLWNQFQWGQDKVLRQWVRESRLDGFGHLMSGIDRDDAPRQAILARFRAAAPAAMANLQKLATAGGA